MKTIAVIGCGNMASPVVESMHQANDTIKFLTYTPSATKAKALAKKVKGTQVDSLDELKDADFFLLGMKPQQMHGFKETSGDLLKGRNLISMLTAINLETLMSVFDTSSVCRIMPNTPSQLGHGIILCSASSKFEDYHLIQNLLSACGEVHALSEKQLDELTVFTGSGPAYVFQFAKYLADEMEKLGYPVELAERLVRKLFQGSSELMMHDKDSLADMVAKVTSKGGVTIEGIKVFQQEFFSDGFARALTAAGERNQELSAELNSLK